MRKKVPYFDWDFQKKFAWADSKKKVAHPAADSRFFFARGFNFCRVCGIMGTVPKIDKEDSIMKKLLAMLLVLAMALGVAPAFAEEAETYELALVTDVGTIDDKSFNQGAWEGLMQYAEENGISYKYYQPPQQSDEDYLATIKLAVDGGAKIVVTPGYLFEVSVYEAQSLYPDVHFILLDGEPHDAKPRKTPLPSSMPSSRRAIWLVTRPSRTVSPSWASWAACRCRRLSVLAMAL